MVNTIVHSNCVGIMGAYECYISEGTVAQFSVSVAHRCTTS